MIGQILGLAVIALFCGAWVTVACRRRKVRLANEDRALLRAVARENARTYQPERVVSR